MTALQPIGDKNMTDRNKFEQMLEHLINEESDKAKELFHQIVVAKSREIYETILAEDFNEAKDEDEDDEQQDESKDEDEDKVDEAKDEEDDEEMDESFGFAEGEDEEAGDDVGGDAGDDMIDDLEDGGDEEGMDDMGGEGDLEDRVVDLEDALDELKAEFEALMSGEEGMDDMGGDDEMDMGGDDMDMEMGPEEDELSFETDNFMREYVEKVGGKDYTSYGKMGDNGANTKSIVAGKNDMGGTVANLKGGTESGPVEANKGHLKGSSVFKGNPKEDNMGNINVPGGNAGKTAFKHKEPTYPNGLGKEQADKSAGSLMNGAPKRAK